MFLEVKIKRSPTLILWVVWTTVVEVVLNSQGRKELVKVLSERGKQKSALESKILWTPRDRLETGKSQEEWLGGQCSHSDEKKLVRQRKKWEKTS